mmetsp:Transcript_8194/g.23404  ORF Transcript_8194/g.23404 Transcript_8194/m.23404 type:complete len:310 (+) Transcript_8194:850-1779(+)
MVIGGDEGGSQHVIKVQLCGRAVPRRAIMKFDALSQVEGVRLSLAVPIGDGPRLREGGDQGPGGSVLDETIVHPVVREELVWAVRMGIQASHASLVAEEARLCPRGDGYGLAPSEYPERVRRIIELLGSGDVTRQPLVDHGRDALPRERQLGGLTVQGLEDLGPRFLALPLRLLNQGLLDHAAQGLLRVRPFQAVQGGVIRLVRRGPRRSESLGVVRSTPRLREGQVEVAVHHGLVEIVLRQEPSIDLNADFGQIADDVVLDRLGCGISFVDDEVNLHCLAVLHILEVDPVCRHPGNEEDEAGEANKHG